MILATLLVDRGGRSRRGKSVTAEITLQVDNDVLQRAIVTGNNISSHRWLTRMVFRTRLFRRHIDDFHFGRCAVERDRSGYRTSRGWVDGFPGSGAGRRRFICGLFVSAAYQRYSKG